MAPHRGDRPWRDGASRYAVQSWKLDLVGLALVVVLVAWILGPSGSAGGEPGPMAGLVVACAGALVLGRVTGGAARWLIPATVVVLAAGAAGFWHQDLFSIRPLSGPFGYANAKSAFFALAAVAALIVAHDVDGAARVLALAAAVGFSVVPLASHSAVASAVVVASLVAAATEGASSRVVIVVCAALFAVVLVATIALGAAYEKGSGDGSEGIAAQFVTERRLALWHDALEIMGEHPVGGVGPGRFSAFSATSREDPDDAHWAHHEFLQAGAETGVAGFVLLVSLFGWGFARLLGAGHADATVALAAVALGGLGVMSCADYVMHFSAIPIMAAALLGIGMATGRGDGTGPGAQEAGSR